MEVGEGILKLVGSLSDSRDFGSDAFLFLYCILGLGLRSVISRFVAVTNHKKKSLYATQIFLSKLLCTRVYSIMLQARGYRRNVVNI